jgi:hypothetical protein
VSANPTRPGPNRAGWRAKPPASVALTGKDGAKKLYAWTRDVAGNVSATASDTVLLDTHSPNVRIAAPAPGATLPALRSISGRTSDPEPASGLKNQRAAIRRKQGTACSWWDPKMGALVAGACGKPKWFPLRSSEQWSRPTGDLQTPGAYLLYVAAVDRAQNRSRVTRAFLIDAGGDSTAGR